MQIKKGTLPKISLRQGGEHGTKPALPFRSAWLITPLACRDPVRSPQGVSIQHSYLHDDDKRCMGRGDVGGGEGYKKGINAYKCINMPVSRAWAKLLVVSSGFIYEFISESDVTDGLYLVFYYIHHL